MRKEVSVPHTAPKHVGHVRSVTSMHRPDYFTKDRYDDRTDLFLSGQLHATAMVGRKEGGREGGKELGRQERGRKRHKTSNTSGIAKKDDTHVYSYRHTLSQ